MELQSFLETSGFDVVAIQETKMSSSVLNAELFSSRTWLFHVQERLCYGWWRSITCCQI